VLRLQGLGLCDLKSDRCVASDQIDSYLEPDERSGITFPSGVYSRGGYPYICTRRRDDAGDYSWHEDRLPLPQHEAMPPPIKRVAEAR
jgi:hypothetical protein